MYKKDLFLAQIRNRAEGGLSGGYQWRRLAELDSLLAFFKVLTAVEFGSGTSSYVLAQKCKTFLTLEEDSAYQRRLIDNAPPNLVGTISKSAVLSKRKIIGFQGEACTHYEWTTGNGNGLDFPGLDLAYVDGPYSDLLPGDESPAPPAESYEMLGVPHANMANVDVLLWGEKHGGFPKVIVVDGRRPTLRLLDRRLRSEYTLFCKTEYPLIRHRSSWARPLLYHSLFVRNDVVRERGL